VRLLLGPPYAPVRPEFAALREQALRYRRMKGSATSLAVELRGDAPLSALLQGVDHVIAEQDKYLQAQVIQANSQSTQADAYNTYYQNLQQLMGQVGQSDTGGNDISSQLATVQTAFATAAATPQNSSLTNAAIGSLDDLTSNMRTISQNIQALRTQNDDKLQTIQRELIDNATRAVSEPAEAIRRDVATLKELQSAIDRRTQDTFEAVYGTIELRMEQGSVGRERATAELLAWAAREGIDPPPADPAG